MNRHASHLFNIIASAMVLDLMAQGGVFYQGTGVPGDTPVGTLQQAIIPDGNLGGIWNVMNLTSASLGNSLTDIQVTLNISGGYNGDLYAYLSYNGVLMPLLNRVGVGTQSGTSAFGYTTSGFNTITLDSSSADIHLNNVTSGTYAADGRAINPLSSAASFNASGTVTLDGQFGEMDPNGQWTLFFADVVAGGGSATLNGWSLDITAIPESVNFPLVCFGIVLIGARLVASFASRSLEQFHKLCGFTMADRMRRYGHESHPRGDA
jgi:subtilisin-like proprotein convertase family protein